MMGLPTCQEVAAQLSKEQDDAQPVRRRLSLRVHLMMCRHCRRYERQLAWLRRSFMRARGDNATPRLSERARARIRRRLRRQDDFNSPPV